MVADSRRRCPLEPEADAAEAGPKVGETRLRQAVVVVHGMGEQWPMSTLRSFVDAVWVRDPRVIQAAGHPNGAKFWITPDERTGSHELRRIVSAYVTRPGAPAEPRIRTDFYELYWADLTQGTTRSRLYAWVSELLFRKRSTIPADAMPIYNATAVAVGAALGVALLVLASAAFSPLLAALIAAIATGLSLLVDRFFLPFYGDVAAYARATPETVAQRAAVRERGLRLLRTLSDDADYDRIVLVGHSLGSILAYDLLQLLWDERRPRGLRMPQDRPLTDAIRAVGDFAILPGRPSPVPGDLAALRMAQWQLYGALRAGQAERPAWKISDLVTVGSPLTHAEFLIASDADEFRRGVAERLFATSPPQSDKGSDPDIMYYSEPRTRAVHHGACFAATRWSNIFDIGNLLWSGDPFSGSMHENFGWGIREYRVTIRRRVSRISRRLFTHTLYWSSDVDASENAEPVTDGSEAHLEALRQALDLLRVENDDP